MFIVAALYKFAPLNDCDDLRQSLQTLCNTYGIKGTLLLAREGINGTIAGTRDGIDAVISHMTSHPLLFNLEYKESHAAEMPFYRMKVRVKKEIVTLGIDSVDPNKKVGTYVSPKEWNELLADPDILLIDTRNDYEVVMGTFKGAVNPNTTSFREFPAFVERNCDPKRQQKVAMFCTGGIRCEKASSYMLGQGYENVYHLKGGILKYLEEIPEQKSLWEGECFVFDERVGVKHNLEIGEYELCRGCRHPVSPVDKTSDKYHEGVSCPYCADVKSDECKRRAVARHKQVLLAAQRGSKHIGA